MEPILPRTDIKDLLRVLRWGKKVEEIWVGKGNYYDFLERAFDWVKVVQLVREIQKKDSRIHIKQELMDYLPKKGNLEEYLTPKTSSKRNLET